MGDFSHLSDCGKAAMVDVSAKADSLRAATVVGQVVISATCVAKLTGDMALEIARTARIAGIQAAKQTHLLVPLCHQLPLTSIEIDIELLRAEGTFMINCETKTKANTGVEMEAMCAAQIAGTTIYDMIKAVDPAATVGPFRLTAKSGGKHGVQTFDPGRSAFGSKPS